MTHPIPKKRARKGATKLGECCPLMAMVLGRRRENDRLGMMLETMYSLSGAFTARDVVVIRFHKARRGGEEPHSEVTYAVVSYCPFCARPTQQSARSRKR